MGKENNMQVCDGDREKLVYIYGSGRMQQTSQSWSTTESFKCMFERFTSGRQMVYNWFSGAVGRLAYCSLLIPLRIFIKVLRLLIILLDGQSLQERNTEAGG